MNATALPIRMPSKSAIAYSHEAAIERACAALNTVGRIAGAAAAPLGLALLLGVWTIAYVGICPPAAHHVSQAVR